MRLERLGIYMQDVAFGQYTSLSVGKKGYIRVYLYVLLQPLGCTIVGRCHYHHL